MLPGLSGYLLSEHFLESQVRSHLTAQRRVGDDHRAFVEWRRRSGVLGPAATVRAMLESGAAPLAELLGFESCRATEQIDAGVIGLVLEAGAQAVALLVTSWDERLDPLWRLAVRYAMRCRSRWCLVFNGSHLRVVDAQRLYSRRYIEFDLDLVADEERTFSAFWSIAHRGAFVASAGQADSLQTLVAASERHAAAVSQALKDGVLTASTNVLGALAAGRKISDGRLENCFEQALTIVYRLLFLLFAEARGLVPLWHPIYRESYSIESLRTAAEDAATAVGLWEALRAIARLAHAGCRAGDLRVTPFNGRLFAPSHTPLADRANLDDEAARRAVRALSSRLAADRAGRERISYRDLGVEQLGAVYETLLDYQPRQAASKISLEPGSGVRKATGTFYTPLPIAEYLVRRTLGPLVRGAAPDQILALRIVDPAMGSGAFLVAACRYLASAYETALIDAGCCHASDFGDVERASIRRTVAERCLYGVDLNPMAVQLARLSLWLATLAADRPLTFLDHHLAAGDSLLGVWMAVLRRAPAAVVRQTSTAATLPLFDARVQRAVHDALPVRFRLASEPGDTLESVRAKERALADLTGRDGPLSRWKRIADVWCAAWFAEGVPAAAFGALSDAILGVPGALPAAAAAGYLQLAEATAAARRFFHWELEFPEVFFDPSGARLANAGFDAILGNPPWDMIRADSGPDAARPRARHDAEATVRFTRDSGIYTAQSDGHANRYQLFLERAMSLVKRGGRIGLVLPSGLASDHGSARLRARLFSGCDVDAVVGFDNHRAVFPIHRSARFLLVTATAGSPTIEFACRLGEHDPGALDSMDDEAAGSELRITPAWLDRVSGTDLTLPNVQRPIDIAILDRAAALFQPLRSPRGWDARFGRELNATDDRGFLREPGHGLPVVGGKQLQPFRVDLNGPHSIASSDARRILRSAPFERARLAYRDVASATNRLTLIAAILPPHCVSTHTVFCLRTPLPGMSQHFLCGLFNSYIVNYLVRLRVTTHVTTAVVEQLPIPTREEAPTQFREIAALARSLARRSDPIAGARLQARVAALYQLSTDEFDHILSTFPLVSPSERDAARATYAAEAQRH